MATTRAFFEDYLWKIWSIGESPDDEYTDFSSKIEERKLILSFRR